MKFVTKTIHCYLGHISDEAMRHVPDNVEGAEKICFPNKKHICHSCTLGKLNQRSFSENPKYSSETLRLIHLDLLELSTLSYSKYKRVITFLDDCSSYCRVVFLCKKSDTVNHCPTGSICRVVHCPEFYWDKAASCIGVAQNRMNYL